MKKYDLIINILFVGYKLTGKTTLFNRISKNCFNYTYFPTNGADYFGDIKIINTKRVKINLWDIGNLSSHILTNYKNKANIVIFFCNLNIHDSQLFILDQLKSKEYDNKKVYILGNIWKNSNIFICSELSTLIYNLNLKIVTINIQNDDMMIILNFYNDILIEAMDSKNYERIS